MRFLLLSFLLFASIQASSQLENHTKQIKQEETINSMDMSDFQDEFKASDKQNNQEIDPLSGYNRAMTKFNDSFYIDILEPTAKAYRFIIPKPIRKGLENVFDNLMYPMRLLNNLLQLKFKNSYLETQRFLLNSTIGVVGLVDVANDNFHIKQHQEDFGQTLGYYGVKSGFHIVWPFLGPSNLRDSVGLITDTIINPMTYMGERGYNLLDSSEESLGVTIGNTINHTSLHIGEYEKLKKDAIDLYPFLKNIYEQRRKKEISE